MSYLILVHIMQEYGMVNLLLALSNVLFGLPILFSIPDDRLESKWLLILVLTASIAMHLSERKHGLPGVPPFHWGAEEFLWCDRVMAVVAGLFVLVQVLKGFPIPWFLGVTGLISMGLSENLEYGPVWFTATHGYWHYCAYQVLGAVL